MRMCQWLSDCLTSLQPHWLDALIKFATIWWWHIVDLFQFLNKTQFSMTNMIILIATLCAYFQCSFIAFLLEKWFCSIRVLWDPGLLFPLCIISVPSVFYQTGFCCPPQWWMVERGRMPGMFCSLFQYLTIVNDKFNGVLPYSLTAVPCLGRRLLPTVTQKPADGDKETLPPSFDDKWFVSRLLIGVFSW